LANEEPIEIVTGAVQIILDLIPIQRADPRIDGLGIHDPDKGASYDVDCGLFEDPRGDHSVRRRQPSQARRIERAHTLVSKCSSLLNLFKDPPTLAYV
jgi:hypothetical protein